MYLLELLLSGGMDSSLITAIASHVSAKTCQKLSTVSFPGHSGYNEEPYAKNRFQIIFGTEHNRATRIDGIY